MKKIVINRCFGGFSLSLKGQLRYAELKGFKLFFYKQTKYAFQEPDRIEEYVRIGVDDNKDSLFINALKVDLGKKTNELKYKEGEYFSERDIERTDEALIQVVEELGKEADGRCAELKIVKIPSDIEWEIDEYDGLETIDEKHRSWS